MVVEEGGGGRMDTSESIMITISYKVKVHYSFIYTTKEIHIGFSYTIPTQTKKDLLDSIIFLCNRFKI